MYSGTIDGRPAMTRTDPVRFAVWLRHGGLSRESRHKSTTPIIYYKRADNGRANQPRLEPQYHASGAELPIPLTQNVSALGQKQPPYKVDRTRVIRILSRQLRASEAIAKALGLRRAYIAD